MFLKRNVLLPEETYLCLERQVLFLVRKVLLPEGIHCCLERQVLFLETNISFPIGNSVIPRRAHLHHSLASHHGFPAYKLEVQARFLYTKAALNLKDTLKIHVEKTQDTVLECCMRLNTGEKKIVILENIPALFGNKPSSSKAKCDVGQRFPR